MASSEKAGALKNAFVNAIADELGGEAMAQAGAMENAKLAGKLGLNVGDQAGVLIDLKNRQYYAKNDHNPITIVTDGSKMNVSNRGQAAANPFTGPYGSDARTSISNADASNLARTLYDGSVPSERDLTQIGPDDDIAEIYSQVSSMRPSMRRY